MEGNIADRVWVAGLEAELRRCGDPARAESVRRYLHSELTHLGVDVPAVRRAVRAAVRHRTVGTTGPADETLADDDTADDDTLADDTADGDTAEELPADADHDAVGVQGAWRGDDVRAAVELLWQQPFYELRLAAIELLIDRVDLLDERDLPMVERLLRECRTWALLDPLAIAVAGPLLDRGATDAAAEAWRQRWITDADFWLRRAALLSHLAALRAGGGDFAAFARLADRVSQEREFFIRKAIGWVMRDTGRRRPELVAAWARPRWTQLSGVTRREIAKVLPTTAPGG